LLDYVEEKGRLIEQHLRHPRIKAIRRSGLMIAVDFETEEEVQRIVRAALDKGLITFWFLSHPKSFRIAPPLTITHTEIREACEGIVEVIETVSNRHPIAIGSSVAKNKR